MSISLFNLSFTAPFSVMLVIVTMREVGTGNSKGTTTSCPYTNLNGVCPINFLHVVLYSHSTVGIFNSQSSLLTLQIFVRAFSKILLKASAVPFA
jgi:hypothetical protein